MTETECVVCGSVNDIRTLRCFVCGAELPPQVTALSALDDERALSSFQALAPPVKVPLSVGALPLEEVLSRRPSERSWMDQGESSTSLDSLLGPEELDLSPPPQEVSFSGLEAIKSFAQGSKDPLESNERIIDDSAPSTWIGIPLVDSESSELKALQALGLPRDDETDSSQESTPSPAVSAPLGSVYSPISQLLNQHNRDTSSRRDKAKKAEIVLPREDTLTGSELKRLEAEATPNRWEMTDSSYHPSHSKDENSSSDSSTSLEGETALKVSIPELLALNDAKKETDESESLAQKSFVPVSSLPHSPRISVLSESKNSEIVESSVDQEDLDQGVREKLITAQKVSDDLYEDNGAVPKSMINEDLTYRIETFPAIPKQGLVLSPFSWFLLALSSITVGVVIALYLMPSDQNGVETKLKIIKSSYQGQHYVVDLQLSAHPSAQLLIPDSYLLEGQAPLIEVKGEATASLILPPEQVTLGSHPVTLQWLYNTEGEGKHSSAVDLNIQIDYQSGKPSYSASRDAYLLPISISDQFHISESDYEFEPMSEANQYLFVVPKKALKGQDYIEFSAKLKGKFTKTKELWLRYDLPTQSFPLTILSPVLRFARPEADVLITGRVSPNAKVKLGALSIDQVAVQELPVLEKQADQNGYFELKVPLNGSSPSVEGQVWQVTLRSVDLNGLTQDQTVEIKRSHEPTWRRYIDRLEQRKNRAKSRYRGIIYSKAVQDPSAYKGMARMVDGVIAFIDRGAEGQAQRFLIHTCRTQNACPVWVEDKDAFWVERGQEVSVFGVVLGEGEYPIADRGLIKAPELRSRLTTPGRL